MTGDESSAIVDLLEYVIVTNVSIHFHKQSDRSANKESYLFHVSNLSISEIHFLVFRLHTSS